MVNRFPKMMLLWEAVGRKLLDMDSNTAKAYGYYMALTYAVMKNINSTVARYTAHIQDKETKKKYRKEKQKELFTPKYLHEYEAIDVIGHPFSPVMYAKYAPNEIYIYVAGKEYPALAKYSQQQAQKFNNIFEFERYRQVAEAIVERFSNLDIWKKSSRWFNKIWKVVRDKDWTPDIIKEVSL